MRILRASEEVKAHFQQFYKAHKVTGELMEEDAVTRIIVTGKFTPAGCARDCGDHYIIARYSSYDRVDKATLAITRDVDDN